MRYLKQIRDRKRSYLLLVIDMCILLCSDIACSFVLPPVGSVDWLATLITFVLLEASLLVYTKMLNSNGHVWRYAGPEELFRLVSAYLLASVTSALAVKALDLETPLGLTLTTGAIAALGSGYARTVYRILFRRSISYGKPNKNNKGNQKPLAIIGAGSAGVALARELRQNKNSQFYVWGFFDDDVNKVGMSVMGVEVKGRIGQLPQLLQQASVNDVVLAIPSLPLERRQEIIALCRTTSCRLKIMPELITAMDSSENRLTNAIRNITIEDLLGRSSVTFQKDKLSGFLEGKTVLVTGGGGSIGSELCRQVAVSGTCKLVIFDMNENTSYMLQQEIRQRINPTLNVVVEIGSMTSPSRVKSLFEQHRPQVVIHAAAHKHVPLMENSPCEAIWNNIFGTRNIIVAAGEHSVEKMVLISTDKAVNPSSVMGATKRYCEDMMRAFSTLPQNKTCFVAVRFGNVLGSSGSVIPLLQDQIAHGGPVTVTDKRMTRYFMTIPEAVGLVLKSGAMASASETYILDMGEPMKILDLAENLIRLSGLEPYKDIAIEEIGLRPGEKLTEELLVNDANHVATKEAKIFVEKNQNTVTWSLVLRQLEAMHHVLKTSDNPAALELLHSYVPSYHTITELETEESEEIVYSVAEVETPSVSTVYHRVATIPR